MLGRLARFLRGSLVDVIRPNRCVGEYGDHARLDFEEASGDVVHFLLAVLFDDANRARHQVGQQRCVPVIDAELTLRPCGNQALDQAGKYFLLRRDDVAVNGHRHNIYSPAPYRDFARSMASSMLPTM